MGKEIDLLVNYPRTKRDVQKRGAEKTEEDRAVARQFGRDFFDEGNIEFLKKNNSFKDYGKQNLNEIKNQLFKQNVPVRILE